MAVNGSGQAACTTSTLAVGTHPIVANFDGTGAYGDSSGALAGGQVVVSPATSLPSLPATGFAPGMMTVLPAQPAEKAYNALGDLWLEIPRLGVQIPIVGVSASENGWDVSWLGGDAG